MCLKAQREPVIWEARWQGHTSMNRTTRRVHACWFCLGMTVNIKQLVGTCEACQTTKPSNQVPNKNWRRLQAGRPWQVIFINIVRPLTSTPNENMSIPVISDHFTRRREVLPLHNGTTETVAKLLEEQEFSYIGVPEGTVWVQTNSQAVCSLGSSKKAYCPWQPSDQLVSVITSNNVDDLSLLP